MNKRASFSLIALISLTGLLLVQAPSHAGQGTKGWQPLPAKKPAKRDLLAGVWQISGRHMVRGSIRGRYRFAAVPGGWRYSAEFSYAHGFGRTETGTAIKRGRSLILRGQSRERGGISGVLRSVAKPELVKKHLTYLWAVPNRESFSGWFHTDKMPRDGGRISLMRGRPANNKVELLVDGPEAFPAFTKALESAKHSIHIETYIWSNDGTGRRMAGLVAKKAKEGVRCRVLMDALGSSKAKPLAKLLSASGAEVHFVNNPYTEGAGNALADLGRFFLNGLRSLFGGKPEAPREKRRSNNRDHRKIVIIDGSIGFAGGMNFAKEYESEWHDIHARVVGDAVTDLQRNFLERWQKAKGSTPSGDEALYTKVSAEPLGNSEVSVVTTLAGLNSGIKSMYLERIAQAKRRIFIENAYFLDEDAIAALAKSAGRGIDVRVITPSDKLNDVGIVKDASKWVRNDIIKSGIKLYHYQRSMMHSKVALTDSHWSTVGSANLDAASFKINSELNLSITDPSFNQELETRVFKRDFAASKLMKETKLGWWETVKSGLVSLFRGFL